jgi:hypothetical protein
MEEMELLGWLMLQVFRRTEKGVESVPWWNQWTHGGLIYEAGY